MEDKTCDILFEYLRSILYDSKVTAPDLTQMEPSAKKLGLGLTYLQKAVEEMQTYTAEIYPAGNFPESFPTKKIFSVST